MLSRIVLSRVVGIAGLALVALGFVAQKEGILIAGTILLAGALIADAIAQLKNNSNPAH